MAIPACTVIHVEEESVFNEWGGTMGSGIASSLHVQLLTETKQDKKLNRPLSHTPVD